MLSALKGTQRIATRMYCASFTVQHDTQLKEFSVGQGEERAVLTYKVTSPDIIDIEHTVVPESLQGKGLGKLLAEAAFEYALDKNIKVKISCGFVKNYLEKNPKPEFENILSR